MKTENLVILFTDIVGYTESTSKLSREESENMLAVHNGLLYPVVKRYGGRIVKTIGDALLIVFHSPTDAMLCAMAMQDSLFAHNQALAEDRQIHIRVAASLGEVRLENKDIFGEAVNITSRIESITPKDEIYLSDAVYMAMSKAEVPCTEVGIKELKGISEPVRIWQIPRFSRPRLVPEDVMKSKDIGEIAFPYGGAHLKMRGAVGGGRGLGSRGVKLAALALAGVVVVSAVVYLVAGRGGDTESGSPAGDAPPARAGRQSPPTVAEAGKPARAAEATAATVDKLAKDLRSKSIERKKEAAKVVFKSYGRNPALLEVANDELLKGFKLGDDYQYVDTMSWLCNILGGSGNARYAETLRQVAAAAPSQKLRRYAEKNLINLQ